MDRLIVLGTGAAIITKYYNTCFVLDDGEQYFLVDGGGGGVMRQFELAGLDWNRLHHVFLSHAHTDHILGMVWAVRRVGHMMTLNQYEGELRVYGNIQVLEDLRAICKITLSGSIQKLFDQRIHFVPVQNGQQMEVLQYQLTFFDILSNKHLQYAFAAQLRDGQRLAFMGDEPCNERNEHYARNCDWMLAEAYCLERDREIFHPERMNHNTVQDTCMLAQRLGVKNLVVWHTEDRTFGEKRPLYTAEGMQYYKGNLHIPLDLDVLELAP